MGTEELEPNTDVLGIEVLLSPVELIAGVPDTGALDIGVLEVISTLERVLESGVLDGEMLDVGVIVNEMLDAGTL